MTSLTFDPLEVISRHSAGLRAAASRDLAAPVEHCPGWTVADLVAHITDVHWSWATVVEERRDTPAPPEDRPSRAADEELIEAAHAQAEHLIEALRGAADSDACWTWAPTRQDVGFVRRHQVQEAAVHHWDAAQAVGAQWSMDPAAAADAVDEFLTFSVATDAYPREGVAPMSRALMLRATDTGDTWVIEDAAPGTVRARRGDGDVPAITAPAAELLLWLYRRVELDTSGVGELAEAFRRLTYTD